MICGSVLPPASRARGPKGRDPRVTLAALARPGLLSVVATRLVDADIDLDAMVSWRP
jgi:hypothetical protein